MRWSEALATLPEDPDLTPRAYVAANTLCIPVPGNSMLSLGLHGHNVACAFGAETYTQAKPSSI